MESRLNPTEIDNPNDPPAASQASELNDASASAPSSADSIRHAATRRPMRYPRAYVWLIFAAAMDIMLTWTILQLGGSEVNPLADWIIRQGGHFGMVVFKLATTLFVILICEFIGGHEEKTGRQLAVVAVGITMMPSVWSMTLLATRL